MPAIPCHSQKTVLKQFFKIFFKFLKRKKKKLRLASPADQLSYQLSLAVSHTA